MYIHEFDSPSALTKTERARFVELNRKLDSGLERRIRRPLSKSEFAEMMNLRRRMAA